MENADLLLERLLEVPDWLLYLILGVAAALENIFPPIPADVVVLVGAVVAGAGDARVHWLFLAVWAGNVGSALLVYGVGRRYGAGFFQGRLGAYLLAPAQVVALSRAYRRFGFGIIFVSRFLPVFRSIVPVFAGVAHVGFWATAIPIAAASAIWYGALVYLGAMAGANWEAVLDRLGRVGGGLWAVAAVLLALLGWWWWSSRKE